MPKFDLTAFNILPKFLGLAILSHNYPPIVITENA